MPCSVNSCKAPEVQTPEAKLTKQTSFPPLWLGSLVGPVIGNSHVIIRLLLKLKKTRKTWWVLAVDLGERPHGAECGEETTTTPTSKCWLWSDALFLSFYPPFEVGILMPVVQMWELRPLLLKPLAQDHKPKAFRIQPTFHWPPLPSRPAPQPPGASPPQGLCSGCPSA